jgi:hypothetical protein
VPRALSLLVLVALTSCGVIGDAESGGRGGATAAQVAAVAGWTRIALTTSYLLVVNVLPGERMFTNTEMASMSPTMGEAILDGKGEPLGPGVRHVEAHVYDRSTGLPLSNVTPTIHLFNRTTGDHLMVPPTLMQDVNIGAVDIHYGNNVLVRGDSDLSLVITVGHEEVTVDAHLD